MSTVHGGPGNIVTSGLVLNLDAANPRSYPPPYNGTVWTDLSGNNNSGSLINGPTFNSGNGGSIVFDGSNDYVLCPKQTSLVSATQFTMCAWMKRNLSNSLVFIGQIETLSNDIAFELWNDGNVYFEVGNGSNSYGVTSNNSTLWQYLTMVFDGTQTGNSNRLKAYIGGSLLTLSYSGTIPPSTGTVNTNLNIGAYLPNSNYSNGNIAQVQIYNRALSASEISQNFNATRARFGI
jgi:hypothetical protein